MILDIISKLLTSLHCVKVPSGLGLALIDRSLGLNISDNNNNNNNNNNNDNGDDNDNSNNDNYANNDKNETLQTDLVTMTRCNL